MKGICMTVRTAHAQGAIFIDRCYLGTKRLLDLLIILLFMLPLSIIILIIAILIKWDSKGPVFFRQRRVGLNGVEFNMFKFRSMYVNCDDSTHRKAIKQYINGEVLNNGAASHNLYKLNDDPR